MKKPEVPMDECQRLKALSDYGILDTSSEHNFDQITALAAEIFGVNYSVVSFVDEKRQWFKSKHGLDISETPRDISFCAHAILGDDLLIVPDTLKDERFRENPIVTNSPYIRFYAGAPLVSPSGHRLGTLCVFHTEPKIISESQKNILLSLARHVMAFLELGKKSLQLDAYLESEERHRMLLETMSEGLVILNEKGINGYNSSALKILQLSTDELVGRSSLPKGWEAIREDGSRFHLRDHPAIIALKTGKVIPAIIMGVRLPDHEVRWITINSVPVDGREGRYVISTFSDITPLIRAAEEHRFVLDAIGIGVWKVNLITGEQIWDRKMYQLYGVDPKFSNEFNNWQKLLTKESKESVDEGLSQILSGSETFDADLDIISPSGERRILGSKGQVIRNKSGEPVMIFGINWDRTKELELQKNLEVEKARSLHNAKLVSIGQLAAGVGHEINNPLAILSGLITMTEQIFLNGASQSDISDKFRKMESSVVRISNIVKGLRTFARSDSNEVTEFDPFQMINETVDLLRDIYSNEGVNIQVMSDKLPVLMKGNRGRLQQVLVNLLSNAKDASLGMSERNITLMVIPLGNEIEILVRDNGSGIPPEIREKIFEPFFTTKDVNLGTGIGLSLVNTIVKEHDGKIELNSVVGKGTDFRVRLPVISVTRPVPGPVPVRKPVQDKIDCRVLIVDDEPELRLVLKEILSYSCSEVMTAASAAEALKILKNQKMDLVLSDIKMPVMDGFDLLKAIRSEPSIAGVKFLFITGGIEMSEAEMKVVKSDSDGIFYKPVKFPDLLRKLKHFFP